MTCSLIYISSNPYFTFFFCREIDDIVLDYVVNILEDVASSASDAENDAFDVAEFCEMLTAYLPQTESIAQDLITEWMFQLAAEQRELDKNKGSKDFFAFSENQSKVLQSYSIFRIINVFFCWFAT